MQRVGLHQQAVELDAIEELAQGRDLAAGIGGVGVLGDRHPKGVLSHTKVSTHSVTSGWAAIHCCSRASMPSTSS